MKELGVSLGCGAGELAAGGHGISAFPPTEVTLFCKRYALSVWQTGLEVLFFTIWPLEQERGYLVLKAKLFSFSIWSGSSFQQTEACVEAPKLAAGLTPLVRNP